MKQDCVGQLFLAAVGMTFSSPTRSQILLTMKNMASSSTPHGYHRMSVSAKDSRARNVTFLLDNLLISILGIIIIALAIYSVALI